MRRWVQVGDTVEHREHDLWEGEVIDIGITDGVKWWQIRWDAVGTFKHNDHSDFRRVED